MGFPPQSGASACRLPLVFQCVGQGICTAGSCVRIAESCASPSAAMFLFPPPAPTPPSLPPTSHPRLVPDFALLLTFLSLVSRSHPCVPLLWLYRCPVRCGVFPGRGRQLSSVPRRSPSLHRRDRRDRCPPRVVRLRPERGRRLCQAGGTEYAFHPIGCPSTAGPFVRVRAVLFRMLFSRAPPRPSLNPWTCVCESLCEFRAPWLCADLDGGVGCPCTAQAAQCASASCVHVVDSQVCTLVHHSTATRGPDRTAGPGCRPGHLARVHVPANGAYLLSYILITD